MAIVQFIIVMQVMAETLMPLWQHAKIATPEFRVHNETKVGYGKMKGQSTLTKRTDFNLFIFVYG
jgi:hypothetical protein